MYQAEIISQRCSHEEGLLQAVAEDVRDNHADLQSHVRYRKRCECVAVRGPCSPRKVPHTRPNQEVYPTDISLNAHVAFNLAAVKRLGSGDLRTQNTREPKIPLK